MPFRSYCGFSQIQLEKLFVESMGFGGGGGGAGSAEAEAEAEGAGSATGAGALTEAEGGGVLTAARGWTLGAGPPHATPIAPPASAAPSAIRRRLRPIRGILHAPGARTKNSRR